MQTNKILYNNSLPNQISATFKKIFDVHIGLLIHVEHKVSNIFADIKHHESNFITFNTNNM